MSREGMKRSALEVHLTHPVGFDDERIASTLTIRDRSSNKTVAIIEMTHSDFHAFMSGRSRQELAGVAYLATPADLAKLRHKRVSVDRVLAGLPSGVTDEQLRLWTDEAAFFLDSDEARFSRSNRGTVTVTLFFYAPPGWDEATVIGWRAGKQSSLRGLSLRGLGVED